MNAEIERCAVSDELAYKDAVAAVTRRKRRVYQPGEIIHNSFFCVVDKAILLRWYDGIELSFLFKVSCPHVKSAGLLLSIKPMFNTYDRSRLLASICQPCSMSRDRKKPSRGYTSQEEEEALSHAKIGHKAIRSWVCGQPLVGFFGCMVGK